MYEINNDEKGYFGGKVDGKGRLRCPMCRGRGYFEPTDEREYGSGDYKPSAEVAREKESNCKLPVLETKGCAKEPFSQNKKITLPSIRRSKNFLNKKPTENTWQSKSNPLIPANGQRSRHEESGPDSGLGLKRNISKPLTANSNESEVVIHLLPSPKTPKNPQEFLKSSLLKLNGNDWNGSLGALKDIVQISRYQPEALEGSMAVIYRGVTTLLKSFRSQITRTACQVVNELFSNVPNTQRPEFDELVSALLQKTADTNKFVRKDANEALDSMVINILPLHSVRTLVQKGIPHRNSTVRATATRLLVCIVGLVGVRGLFAGNKETRNRIMNAAAQSLQDGCQEVRSYACRMMKMLMDHDDFDEVLQGSVSSNLINRIEKTLITIKYHK